ncbi:sodium channel and clathrin linker 1 isoform X2 [Nematostella vectensis]|uniref:sodium channel and clathrin linker 1 isoform X2 n=1 Tax=Nematostella vectensis TaxID=45351 RepID=UPI0020774985|nr:sodium channel and clathrin linker 1 isoform X2 [Nematostella vectensis]
MESSGSDSSYVNFLQDQVRRLNAVLKEYQKKYLPVKDPEIKGNEPLPPWMTNQGILSPLLVEYDETITVLQDQLKFYKNELLTLKQRTDRIVEENKRLHEELRQSIENHMGSVSQNDAFGVPDLQNKILENVQRQLQLVTQEKDSYIEMWENATSELEKLQQIDRERAAELRHRSTDVAALQSDLKKARRFAEDIQMQSKRLKVENNELLKAAQTQDQEIESLRAELRKSKAELKAGRSQNEDYKKTLELLQDRIKARARAAGQGEDDAERSLKSDNLQKEQLQTHNMALETRLAALIKELGKLRSEKSDLEERLQSMQKRNADQEERELEAIAHVRDSVQMVENAVLERDQAVIREKQKTQEANRLQEVVNRLLREAGKRTREEVDAVRNQCNKNMQKLMEEMHYLEMEGAEKQAQLERVYREKDAVEKELEKVYQEGPCEIERVGMTFEELQKRVSIAEMARDEASVKTDTLNSVVKRQEHRFEQEKAQIMSENEQLRRRLKSIETECEEMSENSLNLTDEIDKLKRELLAAKQAQESAEHEMATEVAALKQKNEYAQKDFEIKLRSVEEMNRQSVNELRELLSTQQRVGVQWKEESKAVTQRFEQTVVELRQEINKQRKRNDELNSHLVDERQRADQLESKLETSKQAISKLQKMASDAETRADAASVQVFTVCTTKTATQSIPVNTIREYRQ